MAKLIHTQPEYIKLVDETWLKGSVGGSYFVDLSSEEINHDASELVRISVSTIQGTTDLSIRLVDEEVKAIFDGENLSEWSFDSQYLTNKSIINLFKFMTSSGLWDWIVVSIIIDHYEEHTSYFGLRGSVTSQMFPRLSEIFDSIIDDLEFSREFEIHLQDLHWETECFERENHLNIFGHFDSLKNDHPIKKKWHKVEMSLFKEFFSKRRVFSVHQNLWRERNTPLLNKTLTLMKGLEFSDWKESGVFLELFQKKKYEEMIVFLDQLNEWSDTVCHGDFEHDDLKINFNFESYSMSHPYFYDYRYALNYLISWVDLFSLDIGESEPLGNEEESFGNHHTLGDLIVDQLEGSL